MKWLDWCLVGNNAADAGAEHVKHVFTENLGVDPACNLSITLSLLCAGADLVGLPTSV